MERRQAETLIREGEEQEAIEAARQSQQRLDEWYLTRFMRESLERDRENSSSNGSMSDGSESEEIPGAQPE